MRAILESARKEDQSVRPLYLALAILVAPIIKSITIIGTIRAAKFILDITVRI